MNSLTIRISVSVLQYLLWIFKVALKQQRDNEILWQKNFVNHNQLDKSIKPKAKSLYLNLICLYQNIRELVDLPHILIIEILAQWDCLQEISVYIRDQKRVDRLIELILIINNLQFSSLKMMTLFVEDLCEFMFFRDF